MNILVVAEHTDGVFKKSVYELLGKAGSLGGDVSAIIVGQSLFDRNGADAELGAYGAKVVYTLSGDDFKQYSSGCASRAVQAAIEASDASIVLASSSSIGRDIMPRLSARLQAGLASDVTDIRVEGDDVFAHRAQYAGKVFCDIKIKSGLKLFTVRPDSFPQPVSGEGVAEVKPLDVVLGDVDRANKVVQVEVFTSEVLDLTEADRIVSGGRSVKSKENYDSLIRPLAAALGATPGASRAAVDDGYAAHSDQVGQTGKVVNPTLYIACGISGAIQHLAGMRTSRVIVAINKDKEAPIFKHATYGIVADMFDVCPELTRALSSGQTSVASPPKPSAESVKNSSAANTSPAPVETTVEPTESPVVKSAPVVATQPTTEAAPATDSTPAPAPVVANAPVAVVAGVSAAEIEALKSELTLVQDELAALKTLLSNSAKESTSAIKSEVQRTEKNARSFQEASLRRYDDVERLVTSEVRKVREVLRQGIHNDTADLRASTLSMSSIVMAALVINILAIIGFFMTLFLG